jgi:hypothetical protein
MKFTMKKGTHAYVGSVPMTFTEDTEVDIQANSRDHIAEMMAASGGQRAYGEHLESLKHQTTIKKMIDGAQHEVDVEVSYGANGARVETPIGEPRRIGPSQQQPTQPQPAARLGSIGAVSGRTGGADKATAGSGIGTETVPGASGSGADFEGGRGAAPVAADDGQDVETERLRSVPRTEFVVPPKRFPDEVQTATDPPREELVADSPEREVPYVGEFTQTGAFSRQPSLDRGPGYPFPGDRSVPAAERESTEGRPQPTPDTPGVRDRQFPAPSESAKSRPNQTAVALNVAAKGSDQPPTAGESQTSEDDAAGSDTLPEDFPHVAILNEAGVTKYSQIEDKSVEELQGAEFPGIGEARAEDIFAAIKKWKKSKDK